MQRDECDLVTPPKSLNVLTQNIWAHYFATPTSSPRGVMRGLDYQERISTFVSHIKRDEYDVLFIQELFLLRFGPFVYTTNFHYFVQKMNEIGFLYHTNPFLSLPKYFGQNSGVCVFSKYPLVEEGGIVYQESSEFLNNKGYVNASIMMKHPMNESLLVEVILVCIHMDSRNWLSKKLQLQEIATTLINKKKKKTSTRIEFIIAGDFNVCPQVLGMGGYDNGQQYQFLKSCMSNISDLQDVWTEEESPVTEGHSTLDHIFIDKRHWRVLQQDVVHYKNSEGLAVSDHWGLAVDLSLV